MNEATKFLTSKEIIVVYIVAAAACLLCFIIYLVDKNYYKRKQKHNTRELNKLVEEVTEIIENENEHEQTNEDFSDQEQALDDALAEALDPAKLVEVVNDAIGSGLITIGDQVMELDDLMTTWLDETGDGLYAIGDTLKSELLDNLNAAKQTLTEMGLTNGAGIDLFSKSSTLLNNAAGTTNSMGGSITFGAPLLYVEGNVDDGNIDDLKDEIQKVEQRIYENIAKSLK